MEFKFNRMQIRGFWIFDIDKVEDYNIYKNVVRKTLEVLIKNEMFFPKLCYSSLEDIYVPDNLNVNELLDFVVKTGGVVAGNTMIYEKDGKVEYQDLIRFEPVFRNPGIDITIYTVSDIWLPMTYDFDNYSFVWNLERYHLNKDRLAQSLYEIRNLFDWDGDTYNEVDNKDLCVYQYNYDLFLSEGAIRSQYEDEPNPDFEIEAYIKKLRDTDKEVRAKMEEIQKANIAKYNLDKNNENHT